MKQGIIFSTILHLLIISAVLFAAPLSIKKRPFNYEVIKINAVSAPQSFADSPAPIEDIIIPEVIADDEPFDIPIDDPTSVDKPVVIDKPEPDKPKPNKKDDKPPVTSQKPPTGTTETQTGTDKDKTVETASGSPFAGASVDNADFNHPYWFTLAGNKYLQNFRKSVSLDGTVTCDIFFEVIRSGRIITYEIRKSSGIDAVDRDCLSVFERIKSFPPLPRDFREEIIGVTVTIRY